MWVMLPIRVLNLYIYVVYANFIISVIVHKDCCSIYPTDISDFFVSPPFFLTKVVPLQQPRDVIKKKNASECMVEAGTIGALSKVMEVGAMDSVLGLVAAALRCLTQVASPSEAQLKQGTGVTSDGEDAGGM